jgi:PAS domain S-box-containing protein
MPGVRWFEDLSLRGKLFAAFAPIVLVAIVRLVIALDTANEHRNASQLVDHSLQVISLSEDARSAITIGVGAYRSYLLTGDPADRRTYADALALAHAVLGELSQLTAGEPEQHARWEAIGLALDDWQTVAGDPGLDLRDAVAAGDAGDDDLAAWAASAGEEHLATIDFGFEEAITREQTMLRSLNDRLSSADQRTDVRLIFGGLLALSLAVSAALFLAHDLSGVVGGLAHASQRLAEGDLSQRLLATRRDELGRTARAFDQMADRLQATVRDLETAVTTARQREEQYRVLFVEADRQARELALLDAIRTALARELELEVIFRTVVDATHEVLGYSHVSLYTVEGEGLVLRYQVGYDRVIERVPIGQGIVGRAVETGRSVLLEDVTTDPAFLGAIDGITSEICIPLRDRDRIVGVFNVETVGNARLGHEDLEIIETVSTQLGIAIERARLYNTARDDEARFRSLIQHASDAIGIVDRDRRVTYASPAVERILGYAPEDVIGTRVDLVHPDDLPEVQRQMRTIQSVPGSHVAINARLRHKDGRYRHLELVATNLAEDPAIEGIVYNYRDVTDRITAEAERERQYEAIDRARAEADAILDAAGEAMVLVTPEGVVARVNRRFLEFFDVTWAETAGRAIRRFHHRIGEVFEDPGRFDALIDAVLVDGRTGRSELIVQAWPDRRELDVTTTAVAGAAGELLGFLLAFRDVTHQRAIDRMKSEFVSLASHELRTPLTSIRGYVDLLLEGEVGELNDDQHAFLDIVAGNARRLISLINELLDISRIESGRVTLNRSAVDIGAIARDVATGLWPVLDAKQQALHLEISDDLPAVDGDADRLAQVIGNLLSNASKYTPVGGQIVVTIARDGAELRLAVRDNGIGIGPEDQVLLFTKFFRARNRATEEAGGTGLGLAISRSLVELHGGTIGVESEPGQGSTFTVVLPLALPAREPQVEESVLPAAGQPAHHVARSGRPPRADADLHIQSRDERGAGRLVVATPDGGCGG